jgi:hypothetical protein
MMHLLKSKWLLGVLAAGILSTVVGTAQAEHRSYRGYQRGYARDDAPRYVQRDYARDDAPRYVHRSYSSPRYVRYYDDYEPVRVYRTYSYCPSRYVYVERPCRRPLVSFFFDF